MNTKTAIVYSTMGEEVDLSMCHYWSGGWYETDGVKYAYFEETNTGITHSVMLSLLPEIVAYEITKVEPETVEVEE